MVIYQNRVFPVSKNPYIFCTIPPRKSNAINHRIHPKLVDEFSKFVIGTMIPIQIQGSNTPDPANIRKRLALSRYLLSLQHCKLIELVLL